MNDRIMLEGQNFMLPARIAIKILESFLEDKVNLSEFNQCSDQWQDILYRKLNDEDYFAFFNEIWGAAN
jgi:hypothetical protein